MVIRIIGRVFYPSATGAVAGVLLLGSAVGCMTVASADAPPPKAPPEYKVNVNKPDGLSGYVFYTTGLGGVNDNGKQPTDGGGATAEPKKEKGAGSVARIMTKSGQVVYQRAAPKGERINNFRTQTYRGKPVLTWWQGESQSGHGVGTDFIADDHYNIIASFTPSNMPADAHEFRLTPDGKALVTSYVEKTVDLTSVGGPKHGKIYDCIASVIDVATKRTLFQWDALQHVPVADTYASFKAEKILDPYHMNSIALDPSGNLVISLRHTSTIYNINRTTGAINWRLGGKHSTFALGKGIQFSYQHDAEMPNATTVSMFNNNDGPQVQGTPAQRRLSSLEWIHLDLAARKATLIRNQTHPDDLRAAATGNMQALPNGNAFGSWGNAGHISEFTPDGQMLYDAVPARRTYRAYFDPWRGSPTTPPQLVLPAQGKTDARAIWNGATNVAQWRVLHGPTTTDLTPLTTVAWRGYDTTIPLKDEPSGYYQLQALDAHGHVLVQTAPVH
ncbi:arylsulfotransferase family protein [Actinomadura rayongensis]|uniref:ArsR family transcriptional regulator n=1 Tax=Actinomadura rayongensis TaxID=1429076 RepID=A0A6I4WHT6_9ACTN|nr:arylsulfotransferase family protein [Actinomadura rayongensis]MXQ66162.1 hypothetical protein [Actinomadura rayongensis]